MEKLPQISEAEFEVMKVAWKYAPINTSCLIQKSILYAIFFPTARIERGVHLLYFAFRFLMCNTLICLFIGVIVVLKNYWESTYQHVFNITSGFCFSCCLLSHFRQSP